MVVVKVTMIVMVGGDGGGEGDDVVMVGGDGGGEGNDGRDGGW